MALSPIEHVRLVHDVDRGDRDPLGFDEGVALRGLFVEDGLPEFGIDIGERTVQRADVVVTHVGEHAAERRRDAGEAGHQHLGDAELAGDRRRVHRSRPAEREEHEIARIVPFLDRHHPRCIGHLVVGNGEDRRRRVLGIQPQRLADRLDDAGADSIEVCRCQISGERGGVDTSEHRVGVGHGGGIAAAPVADRTGARASALGADTEQSAGVDPGDTAPTRSDGVDIDQGEMQRHRVGQVLLVRGGRTAVADESQVEARAPHVAREHVVEPGRLAEPCRGDRAGRGTRQHSLRRGMARGAGGHHPSVALHQEELVLEAGFLETLLGSADVARHQRLHPAVQSRSARALELADFREDLRAGADKCVRPQLARNHGRAPLVRRVPRRHG